MKSNLFIVLMLFLNQYSVSQFNNNIQSNGLNDKIQLSLNTYKNNLFSNLNLSSKRPKFPFLFGAEFGKYIEIGGNHNSYLLSFFMDINLYKHSFYLKFEYGKVYEQFGENSQLFLVGFNTLSLKNKKHKLYFSFGAGLAGNKQGVGFFLSVSPKYLFVLTENFGISVGIKYLYGGSHVLGLNVGFQIFEN